MAEAYPIEFAVKKIDTKSIEDVFALTPMQEGMLFHYLREPGSDVYFEQLGLELTGEIDKKTFQRAWNFIVAANEALRTVFRWEKLNEPAQLVMKDFLLEPLYYDLPGEDEDMPRDEILRRLEEIKTRDREKKFDLRETPFRVTLCKITKNHYEMLISHHHILYDGWSNGILLKEFFNTYDELSRGKMPAPVLKTRFKEFVKYTREQDPRDRQEQEEYWKGYLEGLAEQTELSIKTGKAGKNSEAANRQLGIPAHLKIKLETLAREKKITPASVFYTAWGLLLLGYNDCDDMVFGATVSGRTPAIKGIEDMVGLFINTLPLRVKARGEMKIGDLLFDIHQDLQQREKFSNTPLVRIKEYRGPIFQQELFDTLMAVENYPLDPGIMHKQKSLTPLSYSMSAMTHYDLTAEVTLGEEIAVIFSYPVSLFERDMIERMAGHFTCILEEMTANPGKKLYALERLTPEEKRQLLEEFNDAGADFPRDKTIHRLFEEQVEKLPDRIAVIGAPVETLRATSLQITYRQLDKQSGQLAHQLQDKGVSPDIIVAIMTERSIEMVIGILGILKAGGAYLPIDTGYPEERIQYMLEDSKARILLGMEECQKKIIVNCQSLIVNCKPMDPPQAPFHHSSFIIHHSSQLAYIIYTSGSTGKPKGVLIEHASVVNRLFWVKERYGLNERDVILQSAPFIFDVSVCEMFRWVLAGARLCLLPPGGGMDPGLIVKTIARYSASTADFVPSVLNLILDQVDKHKSYNQLSSLRWLFTGVETVSLGLVKRFREILFRFNNTKLINAYGPTESTVDVTSFQCTEDYDTVPIGKPMANVRVYIVDSYGNLQPPGIGGELCIAGKSLARGYLNNPELTSDKFYRSNWSYRSDILYKTGDLCKWLPDGNIEFLGRIDNQVKIRGFRVEPGEIERRLLDHKDIKEAVVIDRLVNEEKCLCAYIAGQIEKTIDISELRQYLSRIMPDYMIPAYFTIMERLPLTANGKVDRKALPGPEIKPSEPFAASRDETEKLLAEIWSHTLGIEKEKIGIDDNFFAWGGHSLKAIQLAGKMHKHFDINIPVTAIFDTPTIRGLAKYIKSKSPAATAAVGDFEPLEALEKKEYYELSPGQQRIYMIQQMHPRSTAFHISSAIEPTGGAHPAKTREIFEKMIFRHESLRTSFIQVEGKPVQRILEPTEVEFDIEYYDLAAKDTDGKIHHFIRPFDLSRAPLLRVGLIKTRDEKPVLLVDIHHIIADGVSVDILTAEFQAFRAGRELPLPSVQYKDFCGWQSRLFTREEMKNHEMYWLQRLKGQLPLLHMPTDYPRSEEQDPEGDYVYYTLEKDLCRKVRRYLRETGATLYMLLLTVFNILLYRYTGQEDIIIGSPVACRDHADLERVVGLLIGALPMRNFPCEYKTFAGFLEEIKKNTLQAYEHRWYPYEEILRNVNYTNHAGRTPISDISLIVQNTDTGNRAQPLTRLKSYEDLFPKISKVDMTLVVEEKGEDIFLSLEYRTGLFKRESMERCLEHFVNLLGNGIAEPTAYLSYIEMMSTGEKQQFTGVVEKCYPLSHAQGRIYYTEKRYHGTPVATLGFIVRYEETLDMELLETAINRVLEKNDGLRLRIVEFPFEKEPRQYVAPYEKQPIDLIDFSAIGKDSEALFGQWLQEKGAALLEFLNKNLFYFARLRFNGNETGETGETGYYLKIHHIISDGWTIHALLTAQIDHIYGELKAGRDAAGEPYPSYLHYLAEEREYLNSSQAEKDKEFWRGMLRPLPPAVRLSTRENDISNIKTGIRKFTLPPDLVEGIYTYTRSPETETSIYKLLFSAFSIYISRAAGLDDFVIGSASHNRIDDRRKQTIGMFAGTIPIRVQVDDNEGFHCFVKKNGNLINTIIKNHGQYPFDVLAAQVREETGGDLNYLLNISFIGVVNTGTERFKLDTYLCGYDQNQLTVYLYHKPGRNILELEWNYRETLFTPSEISRMYSCMMTILKDALQHPGKKTAELELLSPEEKRRILEDFNDTASLSPYPPGLTLHGLFSRQVERVSGRVAVIGAVKSRHVSYRCVDEQSDHLALLLQERGVVSGDIVAIMMEPSEERIIVLLGILKAGAAYLPIDPQCPQERIDYMLKDSAAKTLLTAMECVFNFHHSSFIVQHSNQLAYLIYTSGSTGRPKGVVAAHCNVIAYLAAFDKEFQLNETDTVIQQASYTFDAFVEEMYPVLLKGGKLAVPSRETVKDISLLVEFIARHRVGMITCSPLLLDQLNRLDSHESLRSVHTFISGGDVLNSRFIDKLLKIGKVYNTYGPTESTVCVTYYPCPGGIVGNVPIGKPIANYKVYLLDRNFCPVPPGIPGELCVGGPGVAMGYLNRPELTAEKFDQDLWDYKDDHDKKNKSFFGESRGAVFSKKAPLVLYKTGDLARWLEDPAAREGGAYIIEFLGRLDHQVKIRGFRIELGEIESHLRRHEEIEDAVVLAVGEEAADKFLCAYIVSGKSLEVAALEKLLAAELPDYMIPRHFIRVERIPLTVNGKVDRKALPVPGKTGVGVPYAAPQSNCEEKLAAIWEDVLANNTSLPIGIDDDFFELGGHSLNAAIVISKIHKVLNVKIQLAELFQKPTIRQLAGVIRASAEDRLVSVAAVEEKEYYLLSSAQERLYILQRMDPANTAYHIPHMLKLEGIIDKGKLEGVFKELIRRHESFRTSFVTVADEPVQRIRDDVEFEIEHYNLATDEHGQTRTSHFIRPFDLTTAPLLRVGLVELAEREHILILDMHHIISDGTSMGILTGEAMALYNGEKLPALGLRYRDYAAWQDDWKRGPSYKEEETFWRRQFEGEMPVLDLPFDRPRPEVQRLDGRTVFFELEQEIPAALHRLALGEGATLYMTLLAAFYVFLYKLGSREDIVIGSPVEGRRHTDLQRIIGMFVNTLALRNFPVGEKRFTGFLAEVKTRAISAFENQDYPFEDLVARLDAPRDLSRNPIFDVMFVLQNMESPGIQLPGLTMTSSPFESNTSKFDLTLTALEKEGKLTLSFEYGAALFAEETILRFREYFKNILVSIIERPGRKISAIEIMSGAEREQILYDFNDTAAPYPRDRTIHELFEEQAARTPDRIAVVGATAVETLRATSLQITYREFDEQSGQLAGLLIEKGVLADDIIAIMIERSIEMLIGIYAILKAGGAYLPIDPGYPPERIDYMLKDSAAKILLTAAECVFNFHHSSFINHHSNHLSYIIYTSGTTGKPKGAAIEHHSLVNRLNWMQKQYPLDENDVILHKTPFTFDVSVWEIFWWGMVGAGVCLLAPGGERDPMQMVDAIERNRVTVMHFVPSMLRAFLECIEGAGSAGRLSSLKQVIASGEALTVPLVKRFNELLNKQNGVRLANLYGPTEATIDVSFYDCPAGQDIERVPIGRPIDNICLYIFGKDRQLQPVGVPGELCIAGVGLARGYLNNPELTAEKFFNFHHSSFIIHHSILYCTGDLARWLADGNIEYLGRIDQQVKIRGFRIELEEIERRLEHHKQIKGAVVAVERNGDSKDDNILCAYIVSKAGEELNALTLREYLSGRLPGYMVPAVYKRLDRIPLSPNGKVDRKALRSSGLRLDGGRKVLYAAPGTPTETRIALTWKEILRWNGDGDEIGIHDNFFDIGGTSMDVINVNSRINREFEKQIPIVAMYKYTTIRTLAQFLEQGETRAEEEYPESERTDKIERGRTDKNRMREMRKRGR
ncbi:MAG: amino acid adenylation domain-containing protein [Candidatus Aminicenantes bacterium]|nr:amino acid adenylation domain-containing protein [Candidatus Aminicenantes bacterium]